MKTYKLFLLLILIVVLSILACRPVVQSETPVGEAVQPLPAQVATLAPTATPTPTPAPTPTPTPTVVPAPQATPTSTPRPPMIILTPVPMPPGVDMSPPKPPSKLPPPVGTVKVVETEITGPGTMGGKVYLGNAFPIQLPPDAYIDSYVMEVFCGIGVYCPPTPYIAIMRGKSSLAFAANGEVLSEEIAQGEFGAFDFLKGLRRKTPSPTAAPPTTVPAPTVIGPASKGANIQIAGKTIKLPDNAYIDAFIVSIYCRDLCAQAPLYRIAVSEKSSFDISAVNGKIWMERKDYKEYQEIDALRVVENQLNLK